MSIESDLQLIEDLDGMERRIERGWVRGWWRVGFFNPRYCLTGAMNKQIVGVSIIPRSVLLPDSRSERRENVLRELSFRSAKQAEEWNDRSNKHNVLDRVKAARLRVMRRVEAEQLRLTREAAARAETKSFVQKWFDKLREDEPLVVPEEWALPDPDMTESDMPLPIP